MLVCLYKVRSLVSDHLCLGDLNCLWWHLDQSDDFVIVFALQQELTLEGQVSLFACLDQNSEHAVGHIRVDLIMSEVRFMRAARILFSRLYRLQ